MSLIKSLPSEFRQKCEGMATNLRAQLGLRAFDVLPAERLVQHFKVKLINPHDLPSLTHQQIAALIESNAWSAAIIRQDPLWITYHPLHSPARREADLMHEFAHVLLNHPLVGIDATTGLPAREQQHEDEATYLGGCLQIPKRALQWAVQRQMTSDEIASHFGASKQMVTMRSNMTGVRLMS